jgi:hypothetical protein
MRWRSRGDGGHPAIGLAELPGVHAGPKIATEENNDTQQHQFG